MKKLVIIFVLGFIARDIFVSMDLSGYLRRQHRQTNQYFSHFCVKKLYDSSNIKLLLIRISNESDENAFKQFFDLFAGRLYQFAFSFLKNKPTAEEAVSNVFFKMWLNRKNLANIENIKAYLFKATYNTTLNYLDEENRKKAISLEDVEVDLGIDHICPETELINNELKEMIEKAIESLPSRCNKLIIKNNGK